MISRIFFASIGVIFAFFIIWTTTRNKILERESLIWLFSIVGIAVFGVFPQILDWLAIQLHISYGPSLLFLVSILVLAMLLLRQTIHSARDLRRIEELAHRVALLEEDLRQAKNTMKSLEK